MGLLVPDNAVVQSIPPTAPLSRQQITLPDFSLHDNRRHDAKGADPSGVDEPGQRLVDRAGVCKGRVAEMGEDVACAGLGERVGVCAFGCV